MKKLFYFIIILIFGACSITSEEDKTNYGTNEGSASSPVELTVGTAKSGSVGRSGSSFYKFTTSSTGAGSYKLDISYSSSSSVITYLYSESGYSTVIEWNSCLASCIEYFYYMAFDASTTYYLRIYGSEAVTYSLTVSQGGSEGSKNNPVELTLSTAHSGKVEGTSSYGKSYYKFTTTSADNYTLTMNNSDDLDCQLYSNSGFTTVVDYYYNECTLGKNISDNFTGADASNGSPGSGLTEGTYYLKVEGESPTAKTTTYNITVQAASAL
ncbi:MAG TPA: hypothetical protein DDY69_09480 [Deltaproteobacteria bacterium]|nr:hypothetical protein [Deltaproteobacteria bacterium]